jgi:HEPN domain-containing protein
LDSAVYHLQQGAEKALKGFLVFHEQPISKTHNLVVLALQAGDLDEDFLAWRVQVTGLTPYASEFRYLDSHLEPTPKEFEAALRAARELYTFVLSKLPAASHP